MGAGYKLETFAQNPRALFIATAADCRSLLATATATATAIAHFSLTIAMVRVLFLYIV